MHLFLLVNTPVINIIPCDIYTYIKRKVLPLSKLNDYTVSTVIANVSVTAGLNDVNAPPFGR